MQAHTIARRQCAELTRAWRCGLQTLTRTLYCKVRVFIQDSKPKRRSASLFVLHRLVPSNPWLAHTFRREQTSPLSCNPRRAQASPLSGTALSSTSVWQTYTSRTGSGKSPCSSPPRRRGMNRQPSSQQHSPRPDSPRCTWISSFYPRASSPSVSLCQTCCPNPGARTGRAKGCSPPWQLWCRTAYYPS